MKEIISKFKQLFTRKKSEEQMQMWDDLKDDYTGDPVFHPNLDLDMTHYLDLETQKEKDIYLYDLIKRRNEAHDKHK